MALLCFRSLATEVYKANDHLQLGRCLHSRALPHVNMDTFLMGHHKRFGADFVFLRNTRRLMKKQAKNNGSKFREESNVYRLRTTEQKANRKLSTKEAQNLSALAEHHRSLTETPSLEKKRKRIKQSKPKPKGTPKTLARSPIFLFSKQVSSCAMLGVSQSADQK